MRAAILLLAAIAAAPAEAQEQESFLRLDGDQVEVKRVSDLSLEQLLGATERLLDIEIAGKEQAEGEHLGELPFARIPKHRLWSGVQLTASLRGYFLVEIGAGGTGVKARYRLVPPKKPNVALPVSWQPEIPVVSAEELRDERDHWSRQHALLIRTVFDAGELEPSDLAEAMEVTVRRGLQEVAALPDSGKVTAVLPAPQAVIWAHLAESLADAEVWPAVRFRRFELRRLSAFEAELLVGEFLRKRNPPADEPRLRRRRELVMQVPGQDAVIVRADARILEEIDQLLGLADR